MNINTALLNSTLSNPIAEANIIGQDLLTELAINKAEFTSVINTAFGENWDSEILENLRQQWIEGDFSKLPEIEIRSTAELGGANGAFSVDTGKIYLAEEFILNNSDNISTISDVLLEEIGHSVDAQINSLDSPGDEGDIFSKLLRGVELSGQEIEVLKSEDDKTNIVLGSQLVEIEQNTVASLFDTERVDLRSPTMGDNQIDALIVQFKHKNPYDWIGLNPDHPTLRPVDFVLKQKQNESKISYSFDATVTQDIIDQTERVLKDIESIVNIDFEKADLGEGAIHYKLDSFSNPDTSGENRPSLNFKLGTQEWNILKFTWEKKTDPQYHIRSSDIILNSNDAGDFGTFASDRYATIIHETLHALGLRHPGNYNGIDKPGDIANYIEPRVDKEDAIYTNFFLSHEEENGTNTVMSYNRPNGSITTPMPFDIKALQYLYGAKEHNSENNIYTFQYVSQFTDGTDSWGTNNALATIWDSGGTDTLDFSSLLVPLKSEDANGNGVLDPGEDIDGDGIIGFYRVNSYFDLREGGIITDAIAHNGSKKYKGRFFDPNATEDKNGNGVLDSGEDINGDGKITKGLVVETAKKFGTTTYGTRIAFNTTIENLINSPGNDRIIANEAANTFLGYDPAKSTGNDTIEEANSSDTLDLSSFNNFNLSAVSVKSNDLLIVLGSGSSIDTVTICDYITKPKNRLSVKLADNALFLIGDANNNTISGGNTNDYIAGLEGNDNLFGGGGDDKIEGGVGNDNIYGGYGHDQLIGGPGTDNLYGDRGNDLYKVYYSSDRVIEKSGEGTDLVFSYLSSYTLTSHVENLALFDSAKEGGGNSLNNIIAGNDLNNTLNGFSGTDSLNGGKGDDTYILVDDANDLIIELPNEGTDTIVSRFFYSLASLENVENLTLSGTDNIPGVGNSLNNIINGNDGNNFLYGKDGEDTVFGGKGEDYLYGGNGNDFLAGGDSNDHIYGEADDDILYGFEGDDVLYGGDGIDKLYGKEDNDHLLGEAGDDFLDGGSTVTTTNTGNDTLDGGIGADEMKGRDGNDLYYVNNVNDVVIESVNEGHDTVKSSTYYILSSNVEDLTLLGTNNLDGTGNNLNNLIQGNSGNNNLFGQDGDDRLWGNDGNDTLVGDLGYDELIGDEGDDHLYGGADNDNLFGQEDNDILEGGAGNDYLDGGIGNDALIGGTGDDIYVVDSYADSVTEFADGGIDTVNSYRGIYTLAEHLENLNLRGYAKDGNGNYHSNIIVGNDSNNFLWGGGGNDTIEAGYGDDSLDGGEGADYLEGGLGIFILLMILKT